MRTTKFYTVLIGLFLSTQLFSWGGKGHDIIAEIAEQNLSPRVKKKVEKLLNGKSMVYYAAWMDNLRNDSRYDFTQTWHYANVDSGQTYESMPKVETGDVLTATTLALEKLASKTENDSIKALYLKLLIHMIGDLHCPMHAGRLSDRGGNRHPVLWFNRNTNLHSVWDSQIIESARNWSYEEWAKNLMNGQTSSAIKQLQAGTPAAWFDETVKTAAFLYENTPLNAKLDYLYLYQYSAILEQQLIRGGYRLAAILNQTL